MSIQPVLILHGGAGNKFKTQKKDHGTRKKILSILEKSYQKLLETNATEAVVYAVKLLENDPRFNAGTGSLLQSDGTARLTASIMDGSRQRFAAVINL